MFLERSFVSGRFRLMGHTRITKYYGLCGERRETFLGQRGKGEFILLPGERRESTYHRNVDLRGLRHKGAWVKTSRRRTGKEKNPGLLFRGNLMKTCALIGRIELRGKEEGRTKLAARR